MVLITYYWQMLPLFSPSYGLGSFSPHPVYRRAPVLKGLRAIQDGIQPAPADPPLQPGDDSGP
jgi:hypothetical protein